MKLGGASARPFKEGRKARVGMDVARYKPSAVSQSIDYTILFRAPCSQPI